jgi:stage III sporulation protein SpoIIIAA
VVQLVEVVLDLGRVPFARFPSGELKLRDEVISREDLDYVVARVVLLPSLILRNLLPQLSKPPL